MKCSVMDCGVTAHCRGWCQKHYQRVLRHGDPSISMKRGTKPTPVLDRMADKFLVGDGCWDWIGSSDEAGYGQISVGSIQDGTATRKQAYRVLYEIMVGPIPEGLHLDHLCNRPACVRPDHLEPVTPAENNRRAAERRNACYSGHPWTPESTYVKSSTGARTCRICLKARAAVLKAEREAR